MCTLALTLAGTWQGGAVAQTTTVLTASILFWLINRSASVYLGEAHGTCCDPKYQERLLLTYDTFLTYSLRAEIQ